MVNSLLGMLVPGSAKGKKVRTPESKYDEVPSGIADFPEAPANAKTYMNLTDLEKL